MLFNLLGQAPGTPTSLATRNLLRNLTMEVPSGQSSASAMSLPVLAPADLSDLQPLNLHNRTPLWFYSLREAQATASGEHLGPVGGRIVAEVIYGLVQGDSQSYLGQDPQWTPTYGTGGTIEWGEFWTLLSNHKLKKISFDGTERITRARLDDIEIDVAAETARMGGRSTR